jgi:uncharacterized protein YecE (DUF72 family)
MAIPRSAVGTSGFAFDSWKGVFYPDGTKNADRLAYFASRLSTVELNNTFYRVPKAEVVSGWAQQVPDTFRFAVKATRRLTHLQRLKDPAETLTYFQQGIAPLGDRLAAVLFQLPPNFKADLDRLSTFLEALPPAWPAAFEFRHPTWHDDAVYTTLRDHGASWVVVDSDDHATPWITTAPFGYLRLRRELYDDAALDTWAQRIRASGWEQAFIYFKHETTGPALAEALQSRLDR